jgi:uncharacterized protein (TIGR03083 family)
VPPKRRRYDDATVRAALSAQWDRLVPAAEAATTDPTCPTRLAGWTVGDLLAHLTGTVRRLVAALDRPAPSRASVELVDYYAGADVAEPEPQPDLAAAVEDARRALAAAPANRLVRVGAGDLRLTDYLVTRVVEAVVHGLDLPDPVAPDRAALRVTAQLLVDALAARHPGRTVELRVPPYAAVQCVAGPVHTRGTPGNVVEIEPVAWVELATGRATWPDEVAAGRVAASGTRADLSAYLPLL